jgi:transposase
VGSIARKLKRSPGAIYARTNSFKKMPRESLVGEQSRSIPSEHLEQTVASAVVMDENDRRVPDIARRVLKVIVNQIEDTQTRIAGLETQVLAWHKSNPVSQLLATIPGIGPIIATAIAATVADPSIFRSGREFAACLGLVPRQNSTGGKARLGGISKRGDSYLRRLLVNSAHTVLLCSKQAKTDPWLTSLLGRKPRLVAAVALANKTARVAWAIMRRQDTYRHAAVAA